MDSLQAAIPVLVPVLVALVKALLPRIPKVWLPIIATLLGALLDIGNQLVASGTLGNPVVGAGLGLAGIGVREVIDQIRKNV